MVIFYSLTQHFISSTLFGLVLSPYKIFAKQVYHIVYLCSQENSQACMCTHTHTHIDTHTHILHVRKQSCLDRKEDNDTQWVFFISNFSHSMVLQLLWPTNQLNVIMQHCKHIMK